MAFGNTTNPWEEEKKKRARVSNLGDGVFGTDNDGRIRGISQQAAPAQRVEKLPIPTYPKPNDLPQYASINERAAANSAAIQNINKPYLGLPQAQKPQPPTAAMPTNTTLRQDVTTTKPAIGLGAADNLATPVYAENNQPISASQGNKQFGLSLIPNSLNTAPASTLPNTQANNTGFGLQMPQAPRKEYGEDSRRQILAADIKPYEGMKGLTTKQAEAKARILFGDDAKFANDQYNAQLGLYGKLNEAGINQQGATERTNIEQAGLMNRTALSEDAETSRQGLQLGFDAVKFQKMNDLDSQKLAVAKESNDIQNYKTKLGNTLYDKYLAAETPEQQSEIAAQIQALNGTTGSKNKPLVINQTGETLSPDGLTATKNPSIIYDPDSGQFINLPTAPLTADDPRVQAIVNDTKLSKAERARLLEELGYGAE